MFSVQSEAAEAFVRLFFPENCAKCNQIIGLRSRYLCPRCQRKTQELLLTPLEALQNTAPDSAIGHTGSLYPYRGLIRELIHEVKFQTNPGLLRHLLEIATPLTDALFHEIRYDAVTAVPMHPLRKALSVFNPAEEMALYFARKYGIRHAEGLLRKKGGVPSQMSLNEQERLANLFGAFKMVPSRSLKSKRILLIDDVYTTGTTAGEAARIIKNSICASVDVLTLARTRQSAAEKEAI